MATAYIPGIGNVDVGNNTASAISAGGQIVSSMDAPTPSTSAGTYTGSWTPSGGGNGGGGGGGSSYTPPTTNNTNQNQSLMDWAYKNNTGVNYDAKTNTLNINGQTFRNGYVPGLSLINGKNYVTDSNLLSSSLGNTGAKGADVPMVNNNNNFDVNKIHEMLAAMTPKYEIPEMPKYNLPNLDISSLITPTQGPAITANAADTIYLPTANFKNRALQAQQAQATLANQNYQNQLNAWGSQVDAIQNQATAQRAALASILPYMMQTADQTAADELQKSLDASKLENQDWYIQSLKDEAALKQKLTESQIAENIAQAAKSGRTGGSGGGSDYKLSQQLDDAMAIYKATGIVPDILKQHYPELAGDTPNTQSANMADSIIQDMYDAQQKMRRTNLVNGSTTYRYFSHIDQAKKSGYWDKMTAADRTRVQKAAESLTGKQ